MLNHTTPTSPAGGAGGHVSGSKAALAFPRSDIGGMAN
jgi:hypothetical protein